MANVIVECVPNFSEGRNQQTIDAIAEAIRSAGAKLLSVEAGESTNRTVYTFIGMPSIVISSALAAAEVAYKRIDMRKHKGEHRRMGALDVCPFIPISGCTTEDCISYANEFAAKLVEAHPHPVYLYGFASSTPTRATVPQIREGEYEGLADKITKPQWKPDYGPATFVPQLGATIVGVRKPLIAYNINLISTKEQANRIAFDLRASGRGDKPGKLPETQAMGWYITERKHSQVTFNLLDYQVTGMHLVYDSVQELAKERHLAVLGSEIIGLVPLQSILDAADFYINKDELIIVDLHEKLELVRCKLGLGDSFNFGDKIIEFAINDGSVPIGPLAASTLANLCDSIASRDPAPGGGSVAAIVATLGLSLQAMSLRLVHGKIVYEANDPFVRRLLPKIECVRQLALKTVDDDSQSYQLCVDAARLPATDPRKLEATETATKQSILVPFTLASKLSELWPEMKEMVNVINLNAASDFQVGVQCIKTAIDGAYYNVKINLRGSQLSDAEFAAKITSQVERIRREAAENAETILSKLQQRIDS